jgi:hypothetical protein
MGNRLFELEQALAKVRQQGTNEFAPIADAPIADAFSEATDYSGAFQKDDWTRIEDTLQYINALLGNGPMQHILTKIPQRNTPAANQLSQRLSLGARSEIIPTGSETQRRRAKRAYALLLIVLEGQNDTDVQNKIQRVETDYNGDKNRYDNLSISIWETYDRTLKSPILLDQIAEIRRDPLAFMKTYSVLPAHGIIKAPSSIDYDLITIDGTGPDPMLHRMVLTPSGANEYAFKLTYAPTTKQAQGFPVYFLPWKSARIVKMTLGSQSNLFFTAAINGCSVFVEGDLKSPTVYHAGIDPPWLPMGDGVSTHVKTAFAAPTRDVPLIWRELFWSKSAIPRGSSSFGEVNKTHYIDDGSDPTTGRMTAQVQAFHRAIATPWSTSGFTIEECLPWGCVFGIRNPTTGEWAFYLQENATVKFRDASGRKYGTSRLVWLTRFFPKEPASKLSPPNKLQVPDVNDVTVMPAI